MDPSQLTNTYIHLQRSINGVNVAVNCVAESSLAVRLCQGPTAT